MKTTNMTLTKTLGLAFLGSALLFTSCKKDDDDASNNTPVCKISNEYFYEGSSTTPSDTTAYTYSGDKLSKMTLYGDDLEITIEYTGDNITKRNYIVSGSTTPIGYDQITYNSDGTISKIEIFGLVSGTTFAPVWRTEFTYTSGKISKLTEVDITSGTEEIDSEYTYTFTGNNITQVVATDPSTSQTATYNYTYDSNANYFKKHNAQAYILDSFLGNDGAFLPVFFSANNVTGLSVGSATAPISYTTDDNQNVKDVVIVTPQGQFKINYNYLCQ
jgi:hypothetical protein